jgi:hypothetical protein
MNNLPLPSTLEPLVDALAAYLVDEVLTRHERSFVERRDHWESTVDVLAHNLVQKELLSLIQSSLVPVLVREMRDAVSLQLHDYFEDFDLELSNIFSVALADLFSTKLLPEIAPALVPTLVPAVVQQLRQSIESGQLSLKSEASLVSTLNFISSRQLRHQRSLKRLTWFLGLLAVSFFVCLVAILTTLVILHDPVNRTVQNAVHWLP